MPVSWNKDSTPTVEKVRLVFTFVGDPPFIAVPLLVDLNTFPDFCEVCFSSTVGMFCAIISLRRYHICTGLDK